MFLSLTSGALAQSVIVSGRVTDAETDEGISFATVFVKGADSTVSTDFEGYYKITIHSAAKYIGARCAGYAQTLDAIRKGKEVTMNFELEHLDTNRHKNILHRSEAAAIKIVKQTVAHRESHSRNTLNSYGYEAYTKILVSISDLTERFKKRKIFKPFQYAFDNIDSTSEVKPFIPIFLTETVSDFYHQKRPAANREIIKAAKITGVQDVNISQFLGSSTLETDVYNEYLELIRRQFISPVSSLGLESYLYYLEDSQVIDHIKCHKIRFTPRSLKLAQLEGEMWIADSFFAVKRIRLRLINNSKINPIQSISLYSEYVQVNHTIWMLKKEILAISTLHLGKTPDLVMRKSTFYSNYVINEREHVMDSIFSKNIPDVVVADSAEFKNEPYWHRIRRLTGSPAHEDRVAAMIDTLAGLRVTHRYLNLIQALTIGYVEAGPFTIGNVFSFVTRNRIEGVRLKYGMRTNAHFSKQCRLGGFIAYGEDHVFRYGGEILWLFNQDPRQSLSASYRFDITPTRNFNSFYVTPDILTTRGLRRFEDGRFIPLKFMEMRELKLMYRQELKFGYSYSVTFLNQSLRPLQDFNFTYHADQYNPIVQGDLHAVTISELCLTQRFAWQERFVNSNFTHFSLGSKYPVATVQLGAGVSGVIGSQFDYFRINATVNDTRLLGIAGQLKYNIEAGKYFGTLPFLFLQVPEASETYIAAWSQFNTISKFQFAADRYVKLAAEHHLEGLIFDRIPGLKKLRFREVWGAHMWWGDMTAANRTANYANLDANPMNTGLVKIKVADKTPFVEMNAGIENIFSFFRIDAVWRANYLDPRGTRFSFRYGNCGVRLSFAFAF